MFELSETTFRIFFECFFFLEGLGGWGSYSFLTRLIQSCATVVVVDRKPGKGEQMVGFLLVPLKIHKPNFLPLRKIFS